MPSDARLCAAAIYAIVMGADTYLTVNGLYERANVWSPQFPGGKENRILNACLWATVDILLLLWLLDVFSFGWSDGPEVLMIWAGALALNRMWRARKATAPVSPPSTSP